MDVVCGAPSALTTGSFEFGGAAFSWFWSSSLELTAGSFEFGGDALSWFWSSFLELTAGSFEFGGADLSWFWSWQRGALSLERVCGFAFRSVFLSCFESVCGVLCNYLPLSWGGASLAKRCFSGFWDRVLEVFFELCI